MLIKKCRSHLCAVATSKGKLGRVAGVQNKAVYHPMRFHRDQAHPSVHVSEILTDIYSCTEHCRRVYTQPYDLGLVICFHKRQRIDVYSCMMPSLVDSYSRRNQELAEKACPMMSHIS